MYRYHAGSLRIALWISKESGGIRFNRRTRGSSRDSCRSDGPHYGDTDVSASRNGIYEHFEERAKVLLNWRRAKKLGWPARDRRRGVAIGQPQELVPEFSDQRESRGIWRGVSPIWKVQVEDVNHILEIAF